MTDIRPSVWAPRASRVRLHLSDGVQPMESRADGWWVADAAIAVDTDYGFLIDDDETPLPDPRSRRQPDGVHGLSRTVDLAAHEWQDATWTGRQLAGGVIYELHLGTFTPEGTLDSAIERLDHL